MICNSLSTTEEPDMKIKTKVRGGPVLAPGGGRRVVLATATADVSEPPRPSVVIRLVCGLMPWKPAMTATSLRSLKRLTISEPSMSRMRAEAWASLVLIGICQPCQERA